MLIIIIHTISYDKFVLFKYPYQRISIQNQSFQKLPLNDVLQTITETFDNFAIYRKSSLIPTSNGALPEKAVVQMFTANQKCSQVVMGIDDDCVLVTRIASPVTQIQTISDSASIMDIPQTSKSQVISLSLIWRQQSFNELEYAKHRLSFLLAMLQRKQQHEQFLTKEIIRIKEENKKFKLRIKDLLSSNIKENAMTLEEIRMKLLTRQIESLAKNMRDQLPLFNFLKNYYESWIKGQVFQVKSSSNLTSLTSWQGTIGKQFAVGYPPQQFCQEIKHKSLVILPPKLAELPPVLYSDRVRRLYEKGFSVTNLPISKLLQLNKQIQPQELFHTAYFLLRNRLAVDIYPINHPHSYNLFYLKDLPQRSLIQKFNNKIFPGKSFLEVVNSYSKYKLALSEEETLKYLILKGIVGEVQIFIYRKFASSEDKMPQSEGIYVSMLQKYNMANKNLNYLLSTEPLGNKEGMLLSIVFKFIKNHPREWGFFFVQKS